MANGNILQEECGGLICRLFSNRSSRQADYPAFRNVKNFDLETKHFLYGRIDQQGDAVFVDDGAGILQEVETGKKTTKWAVNFVCDAFDDFILSWKRILKNNIIPPDSLYAKEMKAYRAWNDGDLPFRYNNYLNKLYSDFVNVYLEVDRRHEKIKDFNGFVKQFMNYILRIAHDFPFTKTGYILSVHSSPYISGLMLDIAPENYGLQYDVNVQARLDDSHFAFFVKHANRYGFMVDKNAPWRLVFDINSGQANKIKDGTIVAGQKYMHRYGVDAESMFQMFYRKAHLDELNNVANQLFSFYQQYVLENDTYEQLEHKGSASGNCNKMKITHVRGLRQTALSVSQNLKHAKTEWEEYWLKILLKLRMKETNYPHTVANFQTFADQMIDHYRLFSKNAALNYINSLTKGFNVTKFNREGQYWYGTTKADHESRKSAAIQNAQDPVRVQYPLTGTKNKIR